MSATSSVANGLPTGNPVNFGEIPHHIAMEKIFSLLDTTSLGRTRFVCKNFQAQLKDPYFWQELLREHFGVQTNAIPLELCEQTYKDYYKKAQVFFKNLPRSDLLSSLANGSAFKIAYGLLFPRNFDEYIRSLSSQELGEAFCKSLRFGFMPLVESIMQHPRFAEIFADISVNERYGLGDVYVAAAAQGKIEIMQKIQDSPHFAEILLEGEFGIAQAYRLAARNNQVTAMQEIEQHSVLLAARPSWSFLGLQGAYYAAAAGSAIAAMQHIRQSGRFHELEVTGAIGLARIYLNAAQFNQIEVMQEIERSGRFVEIPIDDDLYGLARAYLVAASHNQVAAMHQIEHSGRFNEIPLEGSNGIIQAYVFAGQSGCYAAMKEIEQLPGFNGDKFGYVEAHMVAEVVRVGKGFAEASKNIFHFLKGLNTREVLAISSLAFAIINQISLNHMG